MNSKIKSILTNGLPYAVVFFVLSVGLGYLFRVNQQQTFLMATILGLLALLANGLVYGRFSKSLKDLDAVSLELVNLETLILQSPANHLVDESLVPGKLFITDRRIIFKVLVGANREPKEYSWNISEVRPFKFYPSFWNSGGEFLLKTTGNLSLMFEVDNIKPWKMHFSRR